MNDGERGTPVPTAQNLEALVAAGALLGSYDDLPLLPRGANPRPYLSRNRVPQPFYVAPTTDAVLAHLRGDARLELRGASQALAREEHLGARAGPQRGPGPALLHLRPGDHVSLPAGVPRRLLPDGECLQVVYRAEPRGAETLLWYCPYCDTRLYPHVVDPARVLPQRAYWEAVQAFNTTTDLRHCEYCGALHPPVNLTDLRWPEVAARLGG